MMHGAMEIDLMIMEEENERKRRKSLSDREDGPVKRWKYFLARIIQFLLISPILAVMVFTPVAFVGFTFFGMPEPMNGTWYGNVFLFGFCCWVMTLVPGASFVVAWAFDTVSRAKNVGIATPVSNPTQGENGKPSTF